MTEPRPQPSKQFRLDRPSPREAFPSGRRTRAGLIAGLLGLGLIGLWVGLFAASVRQDRLAFGRSTWVPLVASMGVDFKLAIDHVARVGALGYNPYLMLGDKQCRQYPYPPMLTRYFRWVTVFDKMTAAVIWQGLLGVFAAAGGLAAWRIRGRLGLKPIPLPLMVAAVLFSTPFVFAVERAQCDPMIIPPMILAAWLLGRREAWAELGAGGVLGLTAWVKYYPGLAVIALLALGRKKGLASFVGIVALVGVFDFDDIRRSIQNGRGIEAEMVVQVRDVHPVSHSFAEAWKVNGLVRGSATLSRVPAAVPVALLLIPAVVLVSRSLARSSEPGPLVFPYFLWLGSAGTFALPYSNDYNLATLPIAMLALWDRRDRAIVQGTLALSLLWLQPIWLPIHGGLLILVKLGALYGVGACLAARASEVGPLTRVEGRANRVRPAFARLMRLVPQEH